MGFDNLWQDGQKQSRIYWNLFKQESIRSHWKWNSFHVRKFSLFQLLAVVAVDCSLLQLVAAESFQRDDIVSKLKKLELFNCWFKQNYRIYIDSISDKLSEPLIYVILSNRHADLLSKKWPFKGEIRLAPTKIYYTVIGISYVADETGWYLTSLVRSQFGLY